MTRRIRALLFVLVDKAGLPEMEERHLEQNRRAAPAVEWLHCRTENEFLEKLPDCEAAFVWRFRREWLERAGKLRFVATPSAGKEWIALRPSDGIALSFGGFHGELMAETVLGLMLAFSRGIKASLDRQASEPWPRAEVASQMRHLRGSRAVIVGFGNIGKWIGRLLAALGVRVTGVNRADMTRPDYFARDDAVFPLSRLDAVLPLAQHLILSLPGGEESDGIIDARRLALLPQGAHVYNVGRGNAIVMDALAEALQSGALGGAGLDVFDQEPLPADSVIRGCPNVILMPHVSAFSPNYLDLFFAEALPRLCEFFQVEQGVHKETIS